MDSNDEIEIKEDELNTISMISGLNRVAATQHLQQSVDVGLYSWQAIEQQRMLLFLMLNGGKFPSPRCIPSDFIGASKQMTDSSFRAHFRMNHQTFDSLLEILAPELDPPRKKGGRPRADAYTQLATFLLRMASTTDTLKLAGTTVSTSSISRYTLRVAHAICLRMWKYLTWPSEAQIRADAEDIKERFGTPGVAGILDSTFIYLAPYVVPNNKARDYTCRKMRYAVNLQLVVNADDIIISATCGWPGSVGDNRVFINSSLGQNLDRLVPHDHQLMADTGYALQPKLITSYKEPEIRFAYQRKFNKYMNTLRARVEHTNGRLKNRFPRLRSFDMDIDSVPLIVSACCILYNFLQSADCWDQVDPEDPDVDSDQDQPRQSSAALLHQARQKRDQMARNLQ